MTMIRARSLVAALTASVLLAACGGGDKQIEVAVQSAPRMKALAVAAQPGVQVVSLTKVSETRVSRTVYDYVFKISVQNDSTARTAIMATATAAGQGTTILDGSVLVGDLVADATASPSDTVTLRHDRTFIFNASAIIWQLTDPINGVPVPPEPDPAPNNSTLAGVDTNRNGIRDDVERLLAREFGMTQANYAEAYNFSIAEQAVIVSPTQASVATYTKVVDCSSMPAKELNKVTYALLNTNQRRSAYAAANAGTTGGACK